MKSAHILHRQYLNLVDTFSGKKSILTKLAIRPFFLPAHASEQGNVIGLVSVYIYMSSKKIVERTRDLIYLKFVVTDFSQKIISPSAGENSGDSA